MNNIVGTKSTLIWAVHLSVGLLVLLWLFPTIGLFVSSFRTTDQISTNGWWSSLGEVQQNLVLRAADPDEFRVERDGRYFVEGLLFKKGVEAKIMKWGVSSKRIDEYIPNDTADLKKGETITVDAVGNYLWSGPENRMKGRGQRVFVTAQTPPDFTLANYKKMLFDEKNIEIGAK